MLDKEIIRKVNDFVYQKPRTMQEIAQFIGKSWVTTDRYIEKMVKEEGTIAVRTFRGGTRGALKIVFWNINPAQKSSFQERLQKQIEAGRQKKDFSPSEIYQYVDDKKKQAWMLTQKQFNEKQNFEDYKNLLMQAESQVLIFSGNLTFCNLKQGDKTISDTIEFLAEKGINFKILTRVELPGIETIKNIFALNNKIGREAIEIRHTFQPLRAIVIDTKLANLKEVKDPKDFPEEELKEPINIIYRIYEEEWVEWLQKAFWNIFRSSISAQKRIDDLKTIKRT